MINKVISFVARKLLGERCAFNLYVNFKYMKVRKSLFKESITPAKRRWLESKSKPRKELTWGLETKGDDFIDKVMRYYKFADGAEILEIGPGLGRLLKSIIRKKIQFGKYLGLEVSKTNVEYLRETFVDPKVQFMEGDPKNIVFESQFDVLVSSLMFKHFMPTFEPVLSNLSKYIKKNGMIFFDLDEDTSDNEDDEHTYTGQYTKRSVSEIIQRCGMKVVGFNEIRHVKERKGLLVIVKR